MPNGEKQETVADEETVALLKWFAGNPDIEKARAEFERAQKVEERFHKDFDGVDFTSQWAALRRGERANRQSLNEELPRYDQMIYPLGWSSGILKIGRKRRFMIRVPYQ